MRAQENQSLKYMNNIIHQFKNQYQLELIEVECINIFNDHHLDPFNGFYTFKYSQEILKQIRYTPSIFVNTLENQLVYEILIFSVTLCYDILVRLYHLHGVLRIRMLLYIKHIFETRILSTQARIKLNLLELISHMSFLCTFNP